MKRFWYLKVFLAILEALINRPEISLFHCFVQLNEAEFNSLLK